MSSQHCGGGDDEALMFLLLLLLFWSRLSDLIPPELSRQKATAPPPRDGSTCDKTRSSFGRPTPRAIPRMMRLLLLMALIPPPPLLLPLPPLPPPRRSMLRVVCPTACSMAWKSCVSTESPTTSTVRSSRRQVFCDSRHQRLAFHSRRSSFRAVAEHPCLSSKS